VGHFSLTIKIYGCLAIKEMQIKTTLRFHLTPVKTSVFKKTNNKCWRGKGNPHTLLVGMQISAATMENSIAVPHNKNYHMSLLYHS
jgi:hypothetical protein